MEPIPALIVSSLAHDYAIVAESIAAGPRGFVAETYVVDATAGRKFFVKLLPHASHLAELTSNLATLEELHALGINNVSRPIRSQSGKFTTQLDGRTLIVFDFFTGRTGDIVGYDFEQYVALLAHIHQITPHVRAETPRETFGLPFASDWQQRFDNIFQNSPTTVVQEDLKHLMQQHRRQITQDWHRLSFLAEQCRQAAWMPLLTHSDAHGGNIIVGDDDRLYLIDWDELMLGPAERDTWFHLHTNQSANDFLRVYRKTFPDYVPNQLFQHFYLFRRFFEDLVGYLIEIEDSSSLQHQRKNFVDLEQTCFEWLWPLMRRTM